MRSHHRIWRSSSAPLQPAPQRWNGWKNQENTTENRWPRLLNANASYAKADLWFVKGRKKLVRKPCAFAKKQERRTVNLPRLRWYAYFPPYGFGLFCSHRIYSHRIKRSPIRKGRFLWTRLPSKNGRTICPPVFSILNCLFHLIPRPALERPISVPFQMRTKFSRCLMSMASVATQRMTSGSQPLRMAV